MHLTALKGTRDHLRALLLLGGLAVLLMFCGLVTRRGPVHTPWEEALSSAPRASVCPWKLANVSFAVTERVINEVLSAITPVIEHAIRNITVPPQKVEHADVDSMDLVNFTLRNLSLHLAAPSRPYMTAEAVGMGVEIGETNFTAHVMLSTCKGVFWATMTNVTLQMPLRLHHFENGTLYANVSDATFAAGNLTVDHRLDSSFCRVAESVVELFMGEINALVERKTIEALEHQLPEAVQAQLNEQLRELPIFFYVDPLIEHDKILGTADLIRGRTTLPTSTASSLPARDVSIEVPELSVNNYLADLRCHEALAVRVDSGFTTDDVKDVFPTVVALCPHCELDVVVSGNAGDTELRMSSSAKMGAMALSVEKLHLGVLIRAPSPSAGKAVYEALARLPDFTTPSDDEARVLAHFFTQPMGRGITDNSTDIPLVVIEVNTTISAQRIAIEGANSDHLAVHVDPTQHFDAAVVASNIGPIDPQILADLESLLNHFLFPLVNAGSPYSLAPVLRRAILDIAAGSVVAASDVSVPHVGIRHMDVPDKAAREHTMKL